MHPIKLGMLGAALALVATSASAAKLEAIKGQVLVNHGTGYQPAAGGLELKAGDMVIASPGGSARITDGIGPAVLVQPGQVIAVSASAPDASTSAKIGDDGKTAWLDLIEGPVLVNHGAGFKLVTQAQRLNVGDTVKASLGGHARLTSPSGKVVMIGSEKTASAKKTGGPDVTGSSKSLESETTEVEEEETNVQLTPGTNQLVGAEGILLGAGVVGGAAGGIMAIIAANQSKAKSP